MNTQNTPEGYGTVTPYFTVENADQLLDFLITVFQASIVREIRYPNNRVQHVRMLVGSSIIMINEASDTYPVNVSQMHLFVDDCDALYDRALQKGAVFNNGTQ